MKDCLCFHSRRDRYARTAALALAVTGLTAIAANSGPSSVDSCCAPAAERQCNDAEAALRAARIEAANHLIKLHVLGAIPAQHREIIQAADPVPPLSQRERELLYGAAAADETTVEPQAIDGCWALPASEVRHEAVADLISRDGWDRMSEFHQRLLIAYTQELQAGEHPIAALCFGPDSDPDMVWAFTEALQRGADRYQQTGRWTSTATNGPGLGQGDPTILTYSFVPNGATIPGRSGFSSGTCNLTTFLNGIYGSPAAWQNIYHQMFARWGELCGITYVHEPNDDGANVHDSVGLVGIRGDLRMAGKTLDGNSNVLAYNPFPPDGDMVIDTADNYYTNTSGNSLRLRNIGAHEHGHGMGQLHVCPRDFTKIMEPFINTGFDGPQHDDIQNAQRHYGDRWEHNDTAGTALDLGAVPDGSFLVTDLSIDDNSDVDYYLISIVDPKLVDVSVTPIGFTYTQGPQTAQCNTGTAYNSLIIHNLDIAILDSDGTTILAQGNTHPAGESEACQHHFLAPQFAYVRISGSSANNIQLYEFGLTFQTPSPGCDGDADGNNAVDVNDITYIVFRLGLSVPDDQGADVDGSGSVDVNDLSYVIFRLGPCP